MKKLLAAGAALLTALVLAGCSSISEGTVTKKDYDAAWTQTVYDQQCVSWDTKTGMCRTYMPHIRYVYWPEKYTLNLRGEEDKTGWVSVSEGEYESYNVGDYYPRESESNDGF